MHNQVHPCDFVYVADSKFIDPFQDVKVQETANKGPSCDS